MTTLEGTAPTEYQAAVKRLGKEYFAQKTREHRQRNPDYWKKFVNPEKAKANSKVFRERHGERRKDECLEYYYAVAKRSRVKNQELALGRAKPECCEICGRADRISFDHCHKTEKARGWLCGGCNTALGLVGDSPELLEKLAAYLRVHA